MRQNHYPFNGKTINPITPLSTGYYVFYSGNIK